MDLDDRGPGGGGGIRGHEDVHEEGRDHAVGVGGRGVLHRVLGDLGRGVLGGGVQAGGGHALGAATTCSESVAVPEFWVVGFTLSLVSTACTVNVEIPMAFGLPVILPVEAWRWSPGGRAPLTIDHL